MLLTTLLLIDSATVISLCPHSGFLLARGDSPTFSNASDPRPNGKMSRLHMVYAQVLATSKRCPNGRARRLHGKYAGVQPARVFRVIRGAINRHNSHHRAPRRSTGIRTCIDPSFRLCKSPSGPGVALQAHQQPACRVCTCRSCRSRSFLPQCLSRARMRWTELRS